jgi:signal transduction histidine kinase
VAGGEVVAVRELFSENPMERNEVTAVLANVGRQLGGVFERVSADKSQRQLSVSLLRSQDDERRRIARELHDSAGQYLAGVRRDLDGARGMRERVKDLGGTLEIAVTEKGTAVKATVPIPAPGTVAIKQGEECPWSLQLAGNNNENQPYRQKRAPAMKSNRAAGR